MCSAHQRVEFYLIRPEGAAAIKDAGVSRLLVVGGTGSLKVRLAG
jgi:putative NADH-flavin reductase